MKLLKLTLVSFLLLAVPFATVNAADKKKSKPKVKVEVSINADNGNLITKIKNKEKNDIKVMITLTNKAGEQLSQKTYTVGKRSTTKSELYLNLDLEKDEYDVKVDVEGNETEVEIASKVIGPTPEYTIKIGRNGICWKKDE